MAKSDDIIATIEMYTCKCSATNQIPDYYQGYVMLKPIKVLYCEQCGDCILTANKFWSWVFIHILHRFWKGKIMINKDNKKETIQLECEERYYEDD